MKKFTFVLLLLISRFSLAQCTTTINCVAYQTKSPTTASQAGSSGIWSTLSNVYGGGNATSSLNGNPAMIKTGNTRTITATGFGFSIPSYKQVCGIGITVTRFASFSGATSDSYVTDNVVSIIGGTSNLASSASWGTTSASPSYGGSGELWGSTFTPAAINHSGFGVTFQAALSTALGAGASTTANLDGFTITIYVEDTVVTCPLPVELSYFTGTDEQSSQRLSWRTESELNNDLFILERMDDPATGQWTVLTTIDGQGTSLVPHEYSYTTRAFDKGKVNYYRLSQVDSDGTQRTFEDWVALSNMPEDRWIIKRVNLLGQEVPETTPGILLIIYSDGSTTRIYNP